KLTGNVYAFWLSSKTMGLSKGSREFLELLNSRGVDYVIIGAHSLVLQSFSRTRWNSRFCSRERGFDPKQACSRLSSVPGRSQHVDRLTSDWSFADYFSVSDLRPNQRLFFGCGSSDGAGA